MVIFKLTLYTIEKYLKNQFEGGNCLFNSFRDKLRNLDLTDNLKLDV